MKVVVLEQLLEAAHSGDRARFDRLFDVWFEVVYAMAARRSHGDRVRAESLTRRFLLESVRARPRSQPSPPRPPRGKKSGVARGPET